jgi:hypothetical protein
MALSAALRRWTCDGMSWKSMLAYDMYTCSMCDTSLSKLCISGLKPRYSSSLKACVYAMRMEGPVYVGMGSACI